MLMVLACIDVEKVIPSHAWLAWHASRNDNQVTVIQCTGELVWSKVTCDLWPANICVDMQNIALCTCNL